MLVTFQAGSIDSPSNGVALFHWSTGGNHDLMQRAKKRQARRLQASIYPNMNRVDTILEMLNS